MARHYIAIITIAVLSSPPTLCTSLDPQALLSTLSLEQKIGQLFMIPAITDPTINMAFLEHTPYRMDQDYVESLITQYHAGGVIFLGSSTASSLQTMINRFQSLSTVPLLIGLDGEWGASMRVRDAIKWPYAITLGAITDTTLLYRLGCAIGAEYKALGVHINFAPVVDINTNCDNPVIGYRSFGSDPDNVTRAARAIARGLRDAGIIPCAKHFPGHGDTAVDSHYALPVVAHDRQRLDMVELYPFTQLIQSGIPAIMTAHIAVPALDSTRRPASLSHAITTQLLKQELGFSGLVITDGLGMCGVTNGLQEGQVELEALLAGNDILLCPVHVPQAVARIKHALKTGTMSIAQLDAHVLKILQAKATITDNHAARTQDIQAVLHSPSAYELKTTLFQHAITLVRDIHAMIPLRSNQKILHLSLANAGTENHFAQELDAVFNVTRLSADNDEDYARILNQLHTYDLHTKPLLISVHGMSKYARDQYSMTPALLTLIQKACRLAHTSIVIVFGNPYSTALLPDAPCLLCGYEDEHEAHDAVISILLGTLPTRGRLPI
jgi:beta-N-acetylhexosaminidase